MRVFRFYVWLFVASSVVFAVALFLVGDSHGRMVLSSDANIMMSVLTAEVFVLGSVPLLLFFLYWPGLESRMGIRFFPTVLGIASLGLLCQQLVALLQERPFGQTYLFMAILVILVAWQYDFRGLVAYTLGMALIEAMIDAWLSLPTDVIILPYNGGKYLPYLTLIARSATFLVMGYVINLLVQAQRQQRQALAEANQKLVRHAAALEQLATSRERVRLSRELHDTLAHTLSALAVQIDAILAVWQDGPNRVREMLERMLATTRSGLDETRRALGALRASPLDELGLAGALCVLAEDFAARHNLILMLDAPGDLDDLPPDAEQCFYRVAQEALENVARHAQAQRLEVHLLQDADDWKLIVSDDGKGFEPGSAQDEERLGLRGMRERAELIGAILDITSQPGMGAKIQLTLGRKL